MKVRFTVVLLLIIYSPAVYSQEEYPRNSLQIINGSFEAGRITEDEAIDLKIKILRGEKLPEEYRSDVPIKCGFGIHAETHEYLKQHPEKELRLQKTTMQAVYDHSFTSNSGTKTFRIHYDVSGPNAVPALDVTTNGIQDWVEETGLAFERSYLLEVDTMGYRQPLSFSAFGYYEIYILDLNNVYGYTETVTQVTNNPDTYTSAIYIENDFSEGFATHGYDALRVTAGHEFFHAIQFSYNFRASDTWYYELSSTWMEDVTYDDVNDYYAYLPGYFNSPNVSLDQTDGYSAAHWNHMIEKKYGRNAIRKSWEFMPSRDAITSIDDAIKDASGSSSNLSRNFSEFSIWNYYTAGRADSVTYFPEAAHYPKIKLSANRVIADTTFTRTLAHLSATYLSFYALDTTNSLITFHAAQSNNFFDIYTIEYNKSTGKNFFLNYGGASSIPVNGLLQGDTLTCVIANIVKEDNSNDFGYSWALTVQQNSISVDPISNFHFYPSPFVLNSSDQKMNFKFVLGAASPIEFQVYTIEGKLLRMIKFGEIPAGPYDGTNGLYWDGKDSKGHTVPSGIYIYQFKGKGFKKTGKIAIVR